LSLSQAPATDTGRVQDRDSGGDSKQQHTATLGANLGAKRANDFPARRTSADKRLAIMPGRELIRTMLNAIQVTTDL